MHAKDIMGLGLTVALLIGSGIGAHIATAGDYIEPAKHLLIARPWDSTNVYVLDSGLTAEDCAYDLGTFHPGISPMVELEPGKWIDREAVQMSCTLDGDF